MTKSYSIRYKLPIRQETVIKSAKRRFEEGIHCHVKESTKRVVRGQKPGPPLATMMLPCTPTVRRERSAVTTTSKGHERQVHGIQSNPGSSVVQAKASWTMGCFNLSTPPRRANDWTRRRSRIVSHFCGSLITSKTI